MKKVGHSRSTFLFYTGNTKYICNRTKSNLYPKEEVDNYLHKQKLPLQLTKTWKIQG